MSGRTGAKTAPRERRRWPVGHDPRKVRRQERAAERAATRRRALALQAQGPDEFPFEYYLEFAKRAAE